MRYPKRSILDIVDTTVRCRQRCIKHYMPRFHDLIVGDVMETILPAPDYLSQDFVIDRIEVAVRFAEQRYSQRLGEICG